MKSEKAIGRFSKNLEEWDMLKPWRGYLVPASSGYG
jgi:hypothetical protein